ncbi:dihydrofolate reductase-like domain-containing protein [Abortiporus biennis]|nr:dihydrofolate reductase-like domain-containing protein [Abortiporus biennis]
MSRLTLIVAATVNNGIGQNAGLPWRLPQEMSYFAHTTSKAPEGSKNVVIMGRNTWESIPKKFRPLKERVNLVVSRNPEYELSQTESSPTRLFPDLSQALNEISTRNIGGNTIHRSFIIGGASLYKDSLLLSPNETAYVDRILLTRILAPSFDDCDVYMPDFQSEGQAWTRASHGELQEWVGFEVSEGIQEENGIKYEFQMWTRTT